MRFACLGSGSRGNGLLVEADGTRLLVDCGFSVSWTVRRLARLGRTPKDLTGILVTHEHGDHVNGVFALARRHRLPVWMTVGTSQVAGGEGADVRFINGHEAFAVGGIGVEPFPVPHDAREPCQFVFTDGARRLGLLTDTGRITPHIRRVLDRCHALLLECNHDETLLAEGPYPPPLKARVGGPEGHLNNRQAAALLSGLDTVHLQHVVAMHLSEQNNTPELAREALAGALGCTVDWIGVAGQRTGFAWRDLR